MAAMPESFPTAAAAATRSRAAATGVQGGTGCSTGALTPTWSTAARDPTVPAALPGQRNLGLPAGEVAARAASAATAATGAARPPAPDLPAREATGPSPAPSPTWRRSVLGATVHRSEEHTSELQSRQYL